MSSTELQGTTELEGRDVEELLLTDRVDSIGGAGSPVAVEAARGGPIGPLEYPSRRLGHFDGHDLEPAQVLGE